MKPSILLAEALTPDGEKLTLHEKDGKFAIRLSGRELMNSAIPASELLLGELGLGGRLKPKKILIGGLGLGFTLRRVLELAEPDAEITVLELIPAVVEWNRTHLAKLNGGCLADPRVTVKIENVRNAIGCASPDSYDAVMLDVDNGPAAMVSEDNKRLYSEQGLNRLHKMLPRGGRLAVWSASIDVRFAARMERAGFEVQTIRAKTHKGAHCSLYAVFVADKPEGHSGPKMYDPTRGPSGEKLALKVLGSVAARGQVAVPNPFEKPKVKKDKKPFRRKPMA
jgi:hypothetical protein